MIKLLCGDSPTHSSVMVYLGVGEFQTSNRKHDLASSDEEVLRDLKSNVDQVGLDVFLLDEVVPTLEQTNRNFQSSWSLGEMINIINARINKDIRMLHKSFWFPKHVN